MREKPTILKNITEPSLVRRDINPFSGIKERFVVKINSALVRFKESGDHVDDRCFSGP